MGASEVSIYPDPDIVLIDTVHTRTFAGVWPARGRVPAGAVVLWIKPTGSEPDPTEKASGDVILVASGAAADSAKSDALFWMEP